ncbi:type VI secretion system Vgr family protein [Chitinophaga sp. 30R24]|uniref:type VI secretion system Vgr family protein n=1 Tax=Chitinophaga sp. 30R24 TaxID=3248838 RepID=UPI003B90B5DE
MSLYTRTTISIGEQQLEQFHSLQLKQSVKMHHEFELCIGYDWLSHYGPNPVAAGKSLLGKEISIYIRPAETNNHYKPLLFNGLITGTSAGKEKNGYNGSCILRGNSPTILLAGQPHMQSFEQLPLSAIVSEVIKNGYPFANPPQINPILTSPLKYIVQYKETGFDFLHRLSQRYGEHFFYNGQQLIFGRYTPRKTALRHQEDLVDYQVCCNLLPAKQQLFVTEYRQQQSLSEDCSQQQVPSRNAYTPYVQAISNKYFPQAATYKVPYVFNSDAPATLTILARRCQQSHIAGMAAIKGNSRNTGLQIGDLVSIQDTAPFSTDYGEFMLTSLIHHCNSNGDYYNTFEGIPADVAIPVINLSSIPVCEAQSAIVTDNHDPKGLGRIRVRFHWQKGRTPWIRLHQPHAGQEKGFYFIPEIGEEVWVHFENGHPEAPYATGCTYNGQATSSFGDDMNNIKAIKTRSGHIIRLDDTTGQENIIIADKGGNNIIIDTQQHNITLSAPETIKLTARNINLQATENIHLQAGLHMHHTAGMDLYHSAGDSLHQYALNDYQLTATNITKIATENIHLQAKEIDKQAEDIHIYSSQEDLHLSANESVCIQSGEKSKIC